MRAVFAVVGFVAFYAVTVAAVLGLAWGGYTLFGLLSGPDSGSGRAMLFMCLAACGCWLGAAVLAWSALPRADWFEPPGPELTRDQHPELFAIIEDVARATGQAMPVNVYAVLEVNAFVSERGGIMGIGSRRVMGIGLGLLAAFSVDEIRAVIAHEFGHFYGGDTRLGPWVYKTRAAMGRSVVNLNKTIASVSEIETVGFVLGVIEAPFRWMAIGYLRLASAVSRAQEFAADAVAARTVGTAPVKSGFRKLAGTSSAFNAYLESEVSGLVGLGVLPPVLEGAQLFFAANRERMAEFEARMEDGNTAALGEASPFDSHPPWSDRVAAVELLTDAAHLVGTPDDRPATVLLRNPENLAHQLVAERVDRPLKDVSWVTAGTHFLSYHHYQLSEHRAWLAARSISQLDRSLTTAQEVAGLCTPRGDLADELSEDELTRLLATVYTSAISVALEHVGYEPRTSPGEPLRFHRGEEVVDPAKLVNDYVLARSSTETEWQEGCARAGLHGLVWADIAWRQRAPV